MAGKGDEQLVEQLIQQIEQLRNEGSAKDREIADLQTALRDERLQRENAVGEERREKEELQQRLHEQGQQIVELRQRNVALQRALTDEQVQREHAVDRERRDKQEQQQRLEREKNNLQQQLNQVQRENANFVELLADADAAMVRYKQENEVSNIPSHDIQLTGTELGRGAYGGEICRLITRVSCSFIILGFMLTNCLLLRKPNIYISLLLLGICKLLPCSHKQMHG